MTKDEFIKGYAERSGTTVEEVLTVSVALPCCCDYEGCKGWAMVFNHPIPIKAHMELYGPKDGSGAEEGK